MAVQFNPATDSSFESDGDDERKQTIQNVFTSVLKYAEVYGSENHNKYCKATEATNNPTLKVMEREVNIPFVSSSA